MRDRALRDARAGFPAVVDEAVRGEGTVVTRHGRSAAVGLGDAERQALTRAKPGLADLTVAATARAPG